MAAAPETPANASAPTSWASLPPPSTTTSEAVSASKPEARSASTAPATLTLTTSTSAASSVATTATSAASAPESRSPLPRSLSPSPPSSVTYATRCSCEDHYSREYVNAEFSVDAATLENLLFSANDESGFFCELWRQNGTRDSSIGAWELTTNSNSSTNTCASSTHTRHVAYTVPVNKTVGPKSAEVEERQERIVTRPNAQYTFETTVATPRVMYGDSFITHNRYCITQIAPCRSLLLVTAEIRYTKSVWSVIKNFIESSTQESLAAHYNLLEQTLRARVSSSNPSAPPPAPRSLSVTSTASASPTAPTASRSPTTPTSTPQPSSSSSGNASSSSPSPSPVAAFMTPATIALVTLSLLLLLTNLVLFARVYSVESRVALLRSTVHHDVNTLFTEYTNGVPPDDSADWLALLKTVVASHARERKQWAHSLQSIQSAFQHIHPSLETPNSDL